MVTEAQRFPIFIVVTLFVFVLILRFITRKRLVHPSVLATSGVAIIVVVGGMLFAKLGQNAGWPWWVYYTVPALVTLVLPPAVFRFKVPELWRYLVLAFLSSPVIHILFSLFLGWHDYMPFLYVPSIHQVLAQAGVGS